MEKNTPLWIPVSLPCHYKCFYAQLWVALASLRPVTEVISLLRFQAGNWVELWSQDPLRSFKCWITKYHGKLWKVMKAPRNCEENSLPFISFHLFIYLFNLPPYMFSKGNMNPGEEVDGIPKKKNRGQISFFLEHNKLKLKTNPTI